MHLCKFSEVKIDFLFQFRGRMCRKIDSSGYRLCHNADAVISGIKCGNQGSRSLDQSYWLDENTSVYLYLGENGLIRSGEHIVTACR